MFDPSWLATTGRSVLMVVISAVGIYLALVIYTRLAGLRSFSKMSSFDFAVTVAFGSVLASTILTREPPLLQAALGLGILYLIQYVVSVARLRSRRVSRLVDNQAVLLMDGQRVLHANMHKARVTPDDLLAKLREANVTRMDQVKAVVMESTGDISVLHGDPEAPGVDPELLRDVDKASGQG